MGWPTRMFALLTAPLDNRAPSPWVATDSDESPQRQLTSGSDLSMTAEGPWAPLIDAGLAIDFNDGAAWPANDLREVHATNVPGNYGEVTSRSNFGWRGWAFPVGQDPKQFPSIGMLPGPVPNPWRPTYNDLPSAAAEYNVRVPSSSTVPVSTTVLENPNGYALDFAASGTASLATPGVQPETLL